MHHVFLFLCAHVTGLDGQLCVRGPCPKLCANALTAYVHMCAYNLVDLTNEGVCENQIQSESPEFALSCSVKGKHGGAPSLAQP